MLGCTYRLSTLSQHKAEYERRCEELAAERTEVEKKLQLLQTTLGQLRLELQVSSCSSSSVSSVSGSGRVEVLVVVVVVVVVVKNNDT